MQEYPVRRSWETNPELCDEGYELAPLSLKNQVFAAWKVMVEGGVTFVRRYKVQGKNGQKVFDLVLRSLYVGISVRLRDFPESKAGAEKLLEDIDRMTAYVQKYSWPYNFCLSCGEPLENKNALYCGKCRPLAINKAKHDRHDYSLPSSLTVKVKKGSAARRGQGHPVNENVRPRDRKKGKGGKSAK